jgi:4-hydroxybutyrate CoA-transferase
MKSVYNWKERSVSAEEAAKHVKSGNRVFLTGNCSAPLEFIQALLARHHELRHVEIVQLLGIGVGTYFTPDMAEHIRINNMFISHNLREKVNQGLADFTPVSLSDIPKLFRSGRIPLDIAVIQVSPPDAHGYCSYGVETGATKSAAESAQMVIAEVNHKAPRTLGDSFIHVNRINHFVEVDYRIQELPPSPPSKIQDDIAKHIAELIPNGATLQMGIGGIPDAVLSRLTDHQHLGIHTELFSDGVIDMIVNDVIDNTMKGIHEKKVVAGFALGTQKLYDFIDDNPIFEFHPTEYVNDPFIIAQNRRMVSINSALEIDITGQVCADSMGSEFFSGAGGQIDFVRGAARSEGGMTFIALPSTAQGGTISRIVPRLRHGAGVVTTRYDVHHVATEYGAVDLWGRTIDERVHALVSITHPDFREDLMRYAREEHYVGKVY